MSRTIADGLSAKASQAFEPAGTADAAVNNLLTGGSQADFLSMPQVGGDPIVESGSNSDGEWTRWADGTQHCRHNLTVETLVNSTNLHATWTFPVPFVAIPKDLNGIEVVKNYSPSGNEIAAPKMVGATSTSAPFQYQVRAGASQLFVSGDSLVAAVGARGRYK